MKRYFAEAEVESAQKGTQAGKDEPGMTELYEHNRIACEATLSLLKETGKVTVIHPTGMGKSFISFRFCEDCREGPVC